MWDLSSKMPFLPMFVGVVYRNGSSGQMGDGDRMGSTTPKLVTSLPHIKFIAAGANHNLAIDGKHAIVSKNIS